LLKTFEKKRSEYIEKYLRELEHIIDKYRESRIREIENFRERIYKELRK